MPLSPPVARKHRHTRTIELKGYEREDGLFDIEAHLIDTKGHEFENRFRGVIPVGAPLHEMRFRLTVDDTLTIRGAEAVTEWSPFPSCPGAAPNYERLIGMRIGPGWIDGVRERLGGTAGCTHLTELLRPMATVAFQTVYPAPKPGDGEERRPALLDTCHGWRADGEAVREFYPRWHREPESKSD